MSVQVQRKRGESFEAMVRRYNRRLQLSGKILEAKKGRFYQGKRNKNETKASALRRLELQKQYEKLRKQGKLPEEDLKKRGRR